MSAAGVSCPRCDAPVAGAEQVCPRCGFALLEERRAGRRVPVRGLLVATVVLVAAVAAVLVLPGAFSSPSKPISGAEAERLLALRYPKLREARDAVIACPRRPIEPGTGARCWVLARVGQQRSVVVRLAPRGDAVAIDD